MYCRCLPLLWARPRVRLQQLPGSADPPGDTTSNGLCTTAGVWRLGGGCSRAIEPLELFEKKTEMRAGASDRSGPCALCDRTLRVAGSLRAVQFGPHEGGGRVQKVISREKWARDPASKWTGP